MATYGESVYNLIPKVYQEPAKPPRYISKSSGVVKEEVKTDKHASKTMGPAKVQLHAPQEFLKKHEKEPKLPDRASFQYSDGDMKKPSVPRVDDKPIMGLKTNKNFINQNAVENIMSTAKKPAKKYADTRNGDKFPLEPSGLEPHFLHKKEYGQVPEYLTKRNEEIARAQDEYDNYVQEHFKRGAMQSLSECERGDILNGLKTNWENLHHEYQGLSVVTDTAPKKNRKERMEAEMKQLERDIELIEKHKVIYIAN